MPRLPGCKASLARHNTRCWRTTRYARWSHAQRRFFRLLGVYTPKWLGRTRQTGGWICCLKTRMPSSTEREGQSAVQLRVPSPARGQRSSLPVAPLQRSTQWPGRSPPQEEKMLKALSEKATRAWVLALTSVASFMVSLDSQVVATALSTIRLDLRASIEQLEWVVNAYILSFAVLLMSGAALGDRFGRRRMFVAGLGLFAAASAACALAPNIGALIATRAVQGAGAALLMPLALALLSAAFPRQERGRALGIFSG